jgi:glycosyltransferase involved in cell wall biosynthesis
VYTEELLAHPPASVEYETYPDALAAGRLVELGRRSDFITASGATKFASLARIARERGINTLRRAGLLFREPFRFFAVEPGAYDLVHCHVFSIAFESLDAPLVISNAAMIEDLYLARQWSPGHVRFASWADAAVARRLHVQHTSQSMTGAAAVVCFTSTLAREMARRGSARPDRVHVAPCFVEPGPRLPAPATPHRIGFIGSAFRAKGGDTVLKAFEIARRERPDLELIVIGTSPPAASTELRTRGITWHDHVPRRELLETHMQMFDVFAYPTECDGLPLTVLEVMGRGIPIATSDYRAMPEVVGHGHAGSVTPQRDPRALADALLRLLDPVANADARRRAADWFDTNYSPDVAVPMLARAYDAAVRIHGHSPKQLVCRSTTYAP